MWTETSTGTFSIGIVDNTTKQVCARRTTADALTRRSRHALEAGAGDEGLRPRRIAITVGDEGPVYGDRRATRQSYGGLGGRRRFGRCFGVERQYHHRSRNLPADPRSPSPRRLKMAASSFEASQTVADVARIKFAVEVVDQVLVVTVAADPTEIMEGGTSMITCDREPDG